MADKIQCDMAVIGGGPGGYTAAFRGADLGKRVVLIEKESRIGGVCLNVGCIPSKTLLHAAEILDEAVKAADYGISFSAPSIDLDILRNKKDSIVEKLTGGLFSLAKARKVTVLQGTGRFTSATTMEVGTGEGLIEVTFSAAVIATGSQPVQLPFIPHEDERIWNSTDALALPFIPKRLAVLGGGIIGLEMAQVYASLGSKITIIEMLDQIIPPADLDMVRPLAIKLKKHYDAIYTGTKLIGAVAHSQALTLQLEGPKAPETIETDALLVAVGRRPNGHAVAADALGVKIDEKGFIGVNRRMETAVPGIFAIGDVVGNPMLAHKAVHEGKVAAEVIAGMKSASTPMGIPSVAYTHPEIAWVGYTEKQAKSENVAYEKAAFNWAASGRALTADKSVGNTKILLDPESGRIIGAGIVGARAGDLIAEAVLAIEMGADATDISESIHPHPTFSETLAFAAEMAEGTITDALPPKKKTKS